MTETNKYIPTPAEQKLLEVLANPENVGKNVTEICKLADVSRNLYYDAFKKQEFVQIYREMSFDLVKQAVMPVINTFIREAIKGSYNHGKIVLEMAGMYTEKQQREITGQNGGPIKHEVDLSGLTDQELDELINQAAQGTTGQGTD